MDSWFPAGIAAAKKLPEFKYEPGKDSMKGWLQSVTRWKVADQFRKRNNPGLAPASGGAFAPSDDEAEVKRLQQRQP